MKLFKPTLDFLIIFVIVLLSSVIVSFLYSWIIHGSGIVDFGVSVRLGIILGIVLTWMEFRKKS
jgi:hypothetical protein